MTLDDVQTSSDPEVIKAWAAEALAAKLYRCDGIAQYVFPEPERIAVMFWLPGVAWSMYCTYKDMGRRFPNVYVHPDHRHQGLGGALWNKVVDVHKEFAQAGRDRVSVPA